MENIEKHECENFDFRQSKLFEASKIIGTSFPVYLSNGVEERFCSECGETLSHIITKPKELVSVVAILRSRNNQKLSGAEVKFLRKSLGLKSKELAELLSVTPETVSRFERDKLPISEGVEKLLRAIVCLRHIKQAQCLDLDFSDLIEMKISSVRDVNHVLQLNLSMKEVEIIANHTPNGDGYKDNKWSYDQKKLAS